VQVKRIGVSLLGQSKQIAGYRQQLIWLLQQLHLVLMPAEWRALVTSINRRGISRTYISSEKTGEFCREEAIPGWYVDTTHSRALIFDLKNVVQDMFGLDQAESITLIRD
jgi:hypothetical protein